MGAFIRAAKIVVLLGLIALSPSALLAQAPQDLPKDGDDRPILGELPRFPLEKYSLHPEGVTVETYLQDLDVVWGLAFAPDGRLFVNEKAGRIRIVSPDGELDPTPWVTVDDVTAEVREHGLFGLALHPEFSEQPWVYVMHSYISGQDRTANRVVRFREVDGRGVDREVILDDIPGAVTHNGGRLSFGPDGMLYIATGDARDRRRAQDLDNLGGSILRLTPEGDVPADNPWPGNPIWAYGFRNIMGMAFRPEDGTFFGADHGPTVEWEPRIGAYDELNIVEKGANYGWPEVVGAPEMEAYVDPILSWIPSVPPGDLVFLNGDLYLSALWSEALVRVEFDDPEDPNRVTGVERWFNTQVWRDGVAPESAYGRLRALAVGPDGALYLGTSNRDGRLDPRPGDDRILRIVIDDDR